MREICRSEFAQLEVIDFSNNKVTEFPVAVVYFLGNLTTISLSNNEMKQVPNWIGFHKKVNSLQIEGNPIKQVRR